MPSPTPTSRHSHAVSFVAGTDNSVNPRAGDACIWIKRISVRAAQQVPMGGFVPPGGVLPHAHVAIQFRPGQQPPVAAVVEVVALVGDFIG